MTAPGSAGPRVDEQAALEEAYVWVRQWTNREWRSLRVEEIAARVKPLMAILNQRDAALASLRAQNERLREALEDALEFIRRDLSRRAEDGSPPLSRAEVIIAAERALASTDTGETPNVR